MRSSFLRAVAAAAALALALAGCGGESAPSNSGEAAAAAGKQGETRIRNRHNEDMLALGDEDRRIGLIRAIRATGNRCPRRVEPNPVNQGEYEGMALWTARCDNNEQYAVFLAPNGDVQVRNCRDMAELRLPACRELPPAAPSQERPKAATKR